MRYPVRIDTLDLKSQITKKLGHQRAEKYFFYLNRLISLKIKKSEFSRVLLGTIGRENVGLHNKFIAAIVKNACLSKTPPSKGSSKVGNGNGTVQLINGINPSPRNRRSTFVRERRDRPSPLGPHGKVQSIVCGESAPRTQSVTELVSPGRRPPAEVFSVEEGEEVDQMMGSPSIQSRSPVTAPFGILGGAARKALRSSSLTSFHLETCRSKYELPDAMDLRKRLEMKLEKEGLGITKECVNVLNSGLDVFLKRLIKPCVELAGSRRGNEMWKQGSSQFNSGLNGKWVERYVQRSRQTVCASLLDFRTAMELNPQALGEDWPVQLERVCLRSIED